MFSEWRVLQFVSRNERATSTNEGMFQSNMFLTNEANFWFFHRMHVEFIMHDQDIGEQLQHISYFMDINQCEALNDYPSGPARSSKQINIKSTVINSRWFIKSFQCHNQLGHNSAPGHQTAMFWFYNIIIDMVGKTLIIQACKFSRVIPWEGFKSIMGGCQSTSTMIANTLNRLKRHEAWWLYSNDSMYGVMFKWPAAKI